MDEIKFASAMIAADKEGIITGNDLLNTAIQNGDVTMYEALKITTHKNILLDLQRAWVKKSRDSKSYYPKE